MGCCIVVITAFAFPTIGGLPIDHNCTVLLLGLLGAGHMRSHYGRKTAHAHSFTQFQQSLRP
jgi:hypothetical protein